VGEKGPTVAYEGIIRTNKKKGKGNTTSWAGGGGRRLFIVWGGLLHLKWDFVWRCDGPTKRNGVDPFPEARREKAKNLGYRERGIRKFLLRSEVSGKK